VAVPVGDTFYRGNTEGKSISDGNTNLASL
jgi:hypothetical protein